MKIHTEFSLATGGKWSKLWNKIQNILILNFSHIRHHCKIFKISVTKIEQICHQKNCEIKSPMKVYLLQGRQWSPLTLPNMECEHLDNFNRGFTLIRVSHVDGCGLNLPKYPFTLVCVMNIFRNGMAIECHNCHITASDFSKQFVRNDFVCSSSCS